MDDPTRRIYPHGDHELRVLEEGYVTKRMLGTSAYLLEDSGTLSVKF